MLLECLEDDLLIAPEMRLFNIAGAVDLGAGYASLIDEATGWIGAQTTAGEENRLGLELVNSQRELLPVGRYHLPELDSECSG